MSSEVITESTTHAPSEARVYLADAEYILPVDKSESDRLLLQHLTFKQAFEDRVLIAPVDKEASLIVLDSGAGSGLWLLDLAKEVPENSLLHGIDIEGNRFPPPGPTRPRNISFSITSILSLPDTWSDRFDLIHQRLLTCGLKRVDWPVALAEIRRALRPGGWVQLGEYNMEWGSGPCALKQVAVYEALAAHRGQNMRVNKDLPELLQSAGFVDVRVERRSIPLGAWGGERGKRAATHVSDFFRALKTPVLEAGGLELAKSDKDLEDIIVGLNKEWDETEGTTIDFEIFCARKPDSA